MTSDQNRDLQLVNNIEKVLNSFEFLEQELDRSESNLSTTSRSNGTATTTTKQTEHSFDNLIRMTADRHVEQTTTTNLTATNRSVDEMYGEKVTKNTVNYLQRDLTLLVGSAHQTPSTTVEVNSLDDYDDIQTVAINCNLTDDCLANNKSTSNLSPNSGINNLISNAIATPTTTKSEAEQSATSSLVKDNRFVKEDFKNKKINKIKTLLFRPAKVGLTGKQAASKQTTTDLITKNEKNERQQKDDSQQIVSSSSLVDANSSRPVNECRSEVKNKLVNVVQNETLNSAAAAGKVTTGETKKKITANDQLVDHLIEENLRTKIDSENNSNLDGKLANDDDDDNYTVEQVDEVQKLVKNKTTTTSEVSSNERSGECTGQVPAVESVVENRIEILNTRALSCHKKNVDQTRIDERNPHRTPVRSNQAQIDQTNLNANEQTNDLKQLAELELDDEQMNANQSIVTSTGANRTDSKLDRKASQPIKSSAKQPNQATSNQANHASKTVRRTSSITSGGQANAMSNSNSLSIVKSSPNSTSSTRPKIIELTKSSDTKRSSANAATTIRTVNCKLKRTPSDQSTVNSSSSRKSLIVNKSSNVSQAAANNKNSNQIKCKTTSVKPRIGSVTSANSQTTNQTVSKAGQLKVNSICKQPTTLRPTTKAPSTTRQSTASKELDQTNTLKKSIRKSNLNKPTTNSSTSSSAASSANSSSINLVAPTISRSNSQLSISNNQVKVNRNASSSFTLQRTNSLKQQTLSGNQQLPHRSKSIYSLPSMIPKVMSKEDISVQANAGGDGQCKDNNSPKENRSIEDKTRADWNGENKSTVKMTDGDSETESRLIRVTDQNQILIDDELSSVRSNNVVSDQPCVQSEDNQSRNAQSTGLNRMTPTSRNDEHATSQFKTNKVQCAFDEQHARLEKIDDSTTTELLFAFTAAAAAKDEPLGEQIHNNQKQFENDTNESSSNDELHLQSSDQRCHSTDACAQLDEFVSVNGNQLVNELNKSEIDCRTKRAETNSRNEIANRDQQQIVCAEHTGRTEHRNEHIADTCSSRTLAMQNSQNSSNKGGVDLEDGDGAQRTVQQTLLHEQQYRKAKLNQFKSNDQQVKQQINELIQCVKNSEFLLSQTIDCQPLTIEIFDGLDDQGKQTVFNYDLQCELRCESTAQRSHIDSKQTDTELNQNEMLLLDAPVAKESTGNMIHNSSGVESSANFNSSKIVNNKNLNSSKSSDLGGSSSATSSSDESSKSPNELDSVERNGLTRKDSVSSSSSSICSSSGSSSGVSSSHSGQFNSLKNKTNAAPATANDILLLKKAITDADSQSWIKAKPHSTTTPHTKYSPSFKRIEHSLKSSLDDKSVAEIQVNNVTVDAGSVILNGNYLISFFFNFYFLFNFY